jgi:hypothetical protein
MDSGYADSESMGGGDLREGRAAMGSASLDGDVPHLNLGNQSTEGSGSSHRTKRQNEQQEYDWDCTDILAEQEGKDARYALVVLNQAMPARWVFEGVWRSGK